MSPESTGVPADRRDQGAGGILNPVSILFQVVLVFFLPGYLLFRKQNIQASFADAAAWSCAFGVLAVTVPLFAFASIFGLIFGFFLTRWVTVGFSLTLSVLLAWRLRAARLPIAQHAPFGREDAVRILFAAAAFIFYLFLYDNRYNLQATCIHEAALLPIVDVLSEFGGGDKSRPLTLFNENGQRLGSVALVSPFVSLAQALGFRLAYAWTGMTVALLAFPTLRVVSQNFTVQFIGAAFLTFNPMLLRLSLLDENVLAFSAGLMLFSLFAMRRRNWFWMGAAAGLFVGVRNEALLCLGGPLYAAAADRETRRSLGRFLGGLAVFCAPWALHALAVSLNAGRPVVLDSFAQFPEIPHRFLGLEFTLRGMLNWPFIERLVRSPFTPFPTALAFPLFLVRQCGILCLSVALAGLTVGWLRVRALTLVYALWLLPFTAMLCAQANWTEPIKMQVAFTAFSSITVWFTLGLSALASPSERRPTLILTALFAAALWGMTKGAARLDFPVDARSHAIRPHFVNPKTLQYDPDILPNPLAARKDSPVYVEWGRKQATRANLLPDFEGATRLWTAPDWKSRRRSLMMELSDPSFARSPVSPYERTVNLLVPEGTARRDPVAKLRGRGPADVGRPASHRGGRSVKDLAGYRCIALDFARPWIEAPDFVRSCGDGSGKDDLVLEPGSAFAVERLDLAWVPDAAAFVTGVRDGRDNVAITLGFGDPDKMPFAEKNVLLSKEAGRPGGTVRIWVPERGAFNVLEIASSLPDRAYRWALTFTKDGSARLSGPAESLD